METTSAVVKRNGFTLIELVITLSIVAILSIVVLPSYEEYLLQGRRSDATTALTTFAQYVERHFLENGSYSGATTALYRDTSGNGHYSLSVTADNNSYQLQATPVGIQLEDTHCGSYTLNELQVRGITGGGSISSCW
ncbi:MAG: type IV pilin protein [Gammaproteobacteria bacterium]|jgi:type IV pilus assembly protein PilE|nr:type IV pilin protein [Gammaproteobacteria bacterium]MBT3488687.1 type IV pilin protein [Gammaproteobacteria bacterium]MBT3717431.1 type IV pilin protein [Gammaproteobacteria bacterium]MBT3844210.1 type IV pilin protein [Gammaproteobacteria bacterium]MBT3892089.1 type IV pilin protein [Gammaproteobacteria bacterium]